MSTTPPVAEGTSPAFAARKVDLVDLQEIQQLDFGLGTDVDGEVLENSTDTEVRVGDDNEMGGSSGGEMPHLGQDDKMAQNSSGRELAVDQGDEPYVGLEFESEAAALSFYSDYGMRVGFITRVSKLSRSRRDRSVIARALVCNKEGYRMPDKRDRKNIKPRTPTRVGCRAMIAIKKLSSGRWIVTKFVKDHSHALTPGKGRKDDLLRERVIDELRSGLWITLGKMELNS
ncbi:hypothetical protein HHK36_022047 [Tetracentron sinense]|uniref:FAR1 domain-containing protein n=1 Tax=Tetracentron sinense TaxID=13715 RepID=A0A835D613_TETSI|nr:hypothetical protein HHK36_022047 [Tetracentron sinense]